MNCEYCGIRLVPIGSSRKNGKTHKDWKEREYHKKCWKIVYEQRKIIEDIEKYKASKVDINHL